jgi:antibiotic biosynthesis monooxygenase (ABM) superfamily enzyme
MTSATNETIFSVVSQMRVIPDRSEEFIRWLERVNEAAERAPGFIAQVSIAPSHLVQVDWAITQRFSGLAHARAWLQSGDWQQLSVEIRPALVGPLDVHLIADSSGGYHDTPVLAVIYTRVLPEQMHAFVQWQQRIAAAEAMFDGFRGYKLEPPIPDVQDEWVMLVRFDTDTHLEAWLNSEQRRQLLREADVFASETRYRKIRGGFESWFTGDDGTNQRLPPAWKQNMVVLLMLYPVAYLFGHWVGTPFLIRNGVPVWGSVFLGNCVSVPLLGWVLVPRVKARMRWWLSPQDSPNPMRDWSGAALVVLLYGFWLILFALLPF